MNITMMVPSVFVLDGDDYASFYVRILFINKQNVIIIVVLLLDPGLDILVQFINSLIFVITRFQITKVAV